MINHLERVGWIVLTITLLWFYINTSKELGEIETWVEMQNKELSLLDSLIGSLDTPVIQSDLMESVSKDRRSDADNRFLRSRGLADPENNLKNDLFKRTDLINLDGIMGGTMRIHNREDIIILNRKWAYALMEDGHIQGAMLLEYEVENGTIKWQIHTSRLLN